MKTLARQNARKHKARYGVALDYYLEGNAQAAIEMCHDLLDEPRVGTYHRIMAWLLLAQAQTHDQMGCAEKALHLVGLLRQDFDGTSDDDVKELQSIAHDTIKELEARQQAQASTVVEDSDTGMLTPSTVPTDCVNDEDTEDVSFPGFDGNLTNERMSGSPTDIEHTISPRSLPPYAPLPPSPHLQKTAEPESPPSDSFKIFDAEKAQKTYQYPWHGDSAVSMVVKQGQPEQPPHETSKTAAKSQTTLLGKFEKLTTAFDAPETRLPPRESRSEERDDQSEEHEKRIKEEEEERHHQWEVRSRRSDDRLVQLIADMDAYDERQENQLNDYKIELQQLHQEAERLHSQQLRLNVRQATLKYDQIILNQQAEAVQSRIRRAEQLVARYTAAVANAERARAGQWTVHKTSLSPRSSAEPRTRVEDALRAMSKDERVSLFQYFIPGYPQLDLSGPYQSSLGPAANPSQAYLPPLHRLQEVHFRMLPSPEEAIARKRPGEEHGQQRSREFPGPHITRHAPMIVVDRRIENGHIVHSIEREEDLQSLRDWVLQWRAKREHPPLCGGV